LITGTVVSYLQVIITRARDVDTKACTTARAARRYIERMSTTPPIALVTGGSRGIGRATALLLADRGTDVIVTYHRDEAAARAVVAAVEQRPGRRAAMLRLDVADATSFPAFADAVRAALANTWSRAQLDFLVHNAGRGVHALVADTTDAQLDDMLAVHVKAAFALTRTLLPLVADGGRIVAVTTRLTRATYPGQAAYALAKGAVEVLTRFLARELGPRGIAVNAVAPGGIATEFGGGMLRDPGLQAAIAGDTALGRMGEPEDIAGVIAALLSPDLRWVTGQRIEATGGYLL
jgi:NAD(P)-dependent dehydrogenase (short-subunit alcohol dehydrogenase family)